MLSIPYRQSGTPSRSSSTTTPYAIHRSGGSTTRRDGSRRGRFVSPWYLPCTSRMLCQWEDSGIQCRLRGSQDGSRAGPRSGSCPRRARGGLALANPPPGSLGPTRVDRQDRSRGQLDRKGLGAAAKSGVGKCSGSGVASASAVSTPPRSRAPTSLGPDVARAEVCAVRLARHLGHGSPAVRTARPAARRT